MSVPGRAWRARGAAGAGATASLPKRLDADEELEPLLEPVPVPVLKLELEVERDPDPALLPPPEALHLMCLL